MSLAETDIQLIAAKLDDIPLIAELAQEIWQEYYPNIISQEQISYMLNKMYSENNLREQIQTQQQKFYLITAKNSSIGFVSVSETKIGEWMLNKFYILKKFRAAGIGTLAFHQLLNEIPNNTLVRLTVNRQNFKSINFYFKNGFQIEKIADFDIGNGYFMNDFIMIRKGIIPQ